MNILKVCFDFTLKYLFSEQLQCSIIIHDLFLVCMQLNQLLYTIAHCSSCCEKNPYSDFVSKNKLERAWEKIHKMKWKHYTSYRIVELKISLENNILFWNQGDLSISCSLKIIISFLKRQSSFSQIFQLIQLQNFFFQKSLGTTLRHIFPLVMTLHLKLPTKILLKF